MATYIILANWTEQGVRNFADSPKRAADFGEMINSLGGTLRDFCWTIGPYDMVAVIEAPDDETYTAIALKVSGLGNVRTTGLRAYGREEFSRIVERAR